jgi:metal-sulfur cluster biosynthetic enzyme
MSQPEASAANDRQRELLDALRDVDDPETGLNLVDLGLIYEVTWNESRGEAYVLMTFTTPLCPAGDVMQDGVERRLGRVPGVRDVLLQITFDPPWTPERVSDEGRRRLGW